jgi:hypothetical protein
VHGALLSSDPGVFDMGAVHVDVTHRGRDPGMAEDLLDRDQVHPGQVELAGAVVPQHVRGELARPARQVSPGGLGQTGPQCLVAHPGSSAIDIVAFGGKQRRTGASVVVVELSPDVLDEPAQRPAGVVDRSPPTSASAAPRCTGNCASTAKAPRPNPSDRKADQRARPHHRRSAIFVVFSAITTGTPIRRVHSYVRQR